MRAYGFRWRDGTRAFVLCSSDVQLSSESARFQLMRHVTNTSSSPQSLDVHTISLDVRGLWTAMIKTSLPHWAAIACDTGSDGEE